jgi:hypothetical protein
LWRNKALESSRFRFRKIQDCGKEFFNESPWRVAGTLGLEVADIDA